MASIDIFADKVALTLFEQHGRSAMVHVEEQVKVAVKIAPECRLGEHHLRVRTATGISELRTFWVGALPSIDEKEPNSDFAAPQRR